MGIIEKIRNFRRIKDPKEAEEEAYREAEKRNMSFVDRIRSARRIEDREEAEEAAYEEQKKREIAERKDRLKQQAKEKKPDDEGEQQNSGGGARGQGGSSFSPTILIEKTKSSHFWLWVIITFLVLWILWQFGLHKYVTDTLKINLFGLGVYLGSLLFIAWIIWGFKSGWKNKDETDFYIAFALLIWLWDMAPAYFPLGPFKIPIPWGGIPFQGFIWNLSGIFVTSWLSILTSSFMFGLLYVNMVWNIVKKEWIIAGLGFLFIVLTNYILGRFFPNQLTYNIPVPGGNWVFLSAVAIGLGTILFLIFMYRKHGTKSALPNFLSLLFMFFVLSFFWTNQGWMINPKALAHASFILIFGFFYMAKREDPIGWHLLIPLLLIIDFYGYGLLFSSDILVLKFIPVLVLFVVVYCYGRGYEVENKRSMYALVTFIIVVTIILILSLQARGFQPADVAFTPVSQEEGRDLREFIGTIFSQTQNLITQRIELATGGYYRGNVEKNQYESLGVYFSSIRAADPRFYTDEPITVWGTIRSKTYQDAVVINFSCYRLQNNKRILADKIIPDFKFPIATLENIDTECTFLPKIGGKDNELKPGTNTITFSADYNFGTDAYLKTYFIDRDRFRAGAREGFDTEAKLLQSYGIKDTKPAPIFTNGPVEIGMQAGPLVAVSEGYTIKPTIGISLLNRQEIQDKDKNIISRWEGKIKNITELVLLVPPGIDISNLESCKSRDSDEYLKCPCNMPFTKYEVGHCASACKDLLLQCNTACVDSYKGTPEDVEGRLSCINECKTSGTNCEKECEFLFSTSGEENLQGSYKGYALDVGSIQFRDLNKDIDKARSFQCRYDVTPALLDATPITTRYFRVRARYNYFIENSVQVNVEEPIVPLVSYSGPLYQTAIDAIKGTFFEPDLIVAIAYVESGLKHCCQETGKTSAKTCVRSNEERCKPENTLTSGTSYGIMQVRYDTPKIIAEVDKRVQRLCKPDETIFDFECNVKVGVDILNEKRRIFGDGCKETEEYKSGDVIKYKTLINACNTCTSTTGVTYSSYTGIRAALRGYNGYGCDGRFDRGYVEKVESVLIKVKDGQIDDTNIKHLFGNREGQGMIYDENIEMRQDILLPS